MRSIKNTNLLAFLGIPVRSYCAGASFAFMSGCCSLAHYQCPPPQTKVEASSQVGLRRPVIPTDACTAYIQVAWTPKSLITGQPGATTVVRVPPDQPAELHGSSSVVNGQSFCDYVIDASPNPAPGNWQVTINGVGITGLHCDADIAVGMKNFHAFHANTQGCTTTVTGLDWNTH